jgi:hypothetical protein
MARLLSQKPLTLADYHAIGEQMDRLERDTSVVGRGRGWRQRVAEILGRSEATLSKCLQFVNCYEPGDLAELAELKRLQVGWVQLCFALGIPDKKKRHRLLQRACLGPALAKGRPKKSRHSCLWEMGDKAREWPCSGSARRASMPVFIQDRCQAKPGAAGRLALARVGTTRQRPRRCCRLGMLAGDRHQIGPFARPSLPPFRIKDKREPPS